MQLAVMGQDLSLGTQEQGGVVDLGRIRRPFRDSAQQQVDLQLPGLGPEGLEQRAVQVLGLGDEGSRRPQAEKIFGQGDQPGAPVGGLLD